MKKRIVSLLLTVCMAAALLPGAVQGQELHSAPQAEIGAVAPAAGNTLPQPQPQPQPQPAACTCGYPQALAQLLPAQDAAHYHAAACPQFDAAYTLPQWSNLPPYPTGGGTPPRTPRMPTNYVAFGDSIPAGDALTGLDDGFVEKLGTTPGIIAANLSVSGATSADMKALITGSTVDTQIAGAAYITITVGGNDLMAVFYELIAAEAGGAMTAVDVPRILSAGASDPDFVSAFVAAGKVIGSAYSNYSAQFQTAFAAVVTNIKDSVAYIRGKNPTAKIYVTNQYNPYKELTVLSSDIGAFMEAGLADFNHMLTTDATGADEIIDIYSAFNNDPGNPLNASMSPTMNLDFHPNTVGHTLYFNALDSKLRASGAAEINGQSYPTLQAALTAAADGQTITLLTDVTESIAVAAGRSESVTLDLNGKTITGAGLNAAIAHNGTGTLTITDTTASGTGGKVVHSGYHTVMNQSTGSIVISGSAQVDNSGSSYNGVRNESTGSIVISDNAKVSSQNFIPVENRGAGSITVSGSAEVSAPFDWDAILCNAAGARVTVSGNAKVSAVGASAIKIGANSSITIEDNAAISHSGATNVDSTIILGSASSVLTMTGGTVQETGANRHAIYSTGTVNLSGGTVQGGQGTGNAVHQAPGVTTAKLNISGGTVVLQGGGGATNFAPEPSSYANAMVTASMDYNGTNPVAAYDPNNLTYKYLKFQQSALAVTGGVQGTDYIRSADGVRVLTATPLTIKNTNGAATPVTNGESIVVAATAGANLTLDGVNIDTTSFEFKAAMLLESSAGAVKVTLSGENTLKSGRSCAGLQKENTANLTITSIQGDGSTVGMLSATGGSGNYSTATGPTVDYLSGGAGIGGAGNVLTTPRSVENITIRGGTITATGALGGAGIGGGGTFAQGPTGGDASNITIRGGKVTATGRNGGAGIGGGVANYSRGGNANDISIYGGEVIATGSKTAIGAGGEDKTLTQGGAYGTARRILIHPAAGTGMLVSAGAAAPGAPLAGSPFIVSVDITHLLQRMPYAHSETVLVPAAQQSTGSAAPGSVPPLTGDTAAPGLALALLLASAASMALAARRRRTK